MTPSKGARPAPATVPAMPAEAELDALISAAHAVAERAYCPYSRLRVGAALLDEAGRIHVGCNVENASYGLTVCAERNALARAVGEGARTFRAVVIVSSRPEPLPPCGACRQVLHEFAPHLWVVSIGPAGARDARRLDELLPGAFGPPSVPPGTDEPR